MVMWIGQDHGPSLDDDSESTLLARRWRIGVTLGRLVPASPSLRESR